MIGRRQFPCINNYVDDSTLFEIEGLCEMNSISLMQEAVNIAAEWTNNNDMNINSEKSPTLPNDLTWKRHVDNIVKKAGRRIYMLYQLERAGVNRAELVYFFLSIIFLNIFDISAILLSYYVQTYSNYP